MTLKLSVKSQTFQLHFRNKLFGEFQVLSTFDAHTNVTNY